MGVNKLWSKLRDEKVSKAFKKEDVPLGSTLLVDGHSFLFQLLDPNMKVIHANMFKYEKQFGGDYENFGELLKAELDRLQAKLGFKLVVFLDGKKNPLKNGTNENRQNTIINEWNNWYKFVVNGGNRKNLKKLRTPLPLLIKQQFLCVLELEKIDVVHCSFEADQTIAIECVRRNEAGQRCYVYSDDSDFLLMRNCPLIAMNSLEKDNFSAAKLADRTVFNKKRSGATKVHVWRRDDVARLLSIKKDEIVDWAVIRQGNDFTLPLIEARKTDGEEFSLAVDYSRALYELEDLSRFYELEQTIKDVSKRMLKLEFITGTRLSDEEKQVIDDWVANNPSLLNKNPNAWTKIINCFCKHYRHTFSVEDTDLIQPHHWDAFCEIVGGKHRDKPTHKSVSLHWDNVIASNHLQAVLKHLTNAVKTHGDETEQKMITFMPSRVFDAKTFHFVSNEKMCSSQIPVDEPTSSESHPQSDATHRFSVDEHRESILESVRRNPVTMINGETGCGKSTGIPMILIEDGEQRQEPCKIIVAQPRRVAVHNLFKFMRKMHCNKVGMRMGGGVRDEPSDTQILFVTTGYLVKLMAHKKESLKSFTHIIIDEVHERSLEGDMLCWLTKRYLQKHSAIKVLLMSATLSTDLYHKYFDFLGELPCLFVGKRRHPIQTVYVENLVDDAKFKHVRKISEKLVTMCKTAADSRFTNPIPPTFVNEQYSLVTELVRFKGKLGKAVLVFVSGIADIIELQSRFEDMPRYRCVAIHSDIPFEEQESALQPAAPDEVKVIIATNAAESSVTLPDVDVVLCLGTQKTVSYEPKDPLRSVLSNAWVSKSSAVQRAGRTGRVRPGEVYRLYTKEIFEQFNEHQQADIHSKPLHEVILTVKSVFLYDIDISSELKQLPEAPNLENLNSSLGLLHALKIIEKPTHFPKLTTNGHFVAKMPVDITLSKLISRGITLGVGAEAVVMASALSQSKALFRTVSPASRMNVDRRNATVRASFLSMLSFDNGAYSEPIMLLQLYLAWIALPTSSHDTMKAFCKQHGVFIARFKTFITSTKQLWGSVNYALNSSQPLDLAQVLAHAQWTPRRLNMLRLILLWTFQHNLLSAKIEKEDKSGESGANSVRIQEKDTSKALRTSFESQFPEPCNALSWTVPSSTMTSDVLLDRVVSPESLPSLLNDICDAMLAAHPELDVVIALLQSMPAREGKSSAFSIAIVLSERHLKNKKNVLTHVAQLTGGETLTAFSQSSVYTWYFMQTADETVGESLWTLSLEKQCGLIVSIDAEAKQAKVKAVNAQLSFEVLRAMLSKQPLAKRVKKELRMSLERSHKVHSSALVAKFEAKVNSAGMLTDITPAMRLFNAYGLSQRDRKMRFSVNEPTPVATTEAAADTTASPQLESNNQKGKEKEKGKNKNSSARTVVVETQCVKTMWTAQDREKGLLAAYLSSDSLLVTSRFFPRPGMSPTVYGTCFNALKVTTRKPGKPPFSIMMCDGVTLFPSEITWILRALLCIEEELSEDSEKQLNTLTKSESASALCKAIRKMLSFEDKIEVNAQLVKAIDELFGEYEEQAEEANAELSTFSSLNV